MRKIIAALLGLLLVCGALTGGALWYVRPPEPLDLAYGQISWTGKAADVLLSRKLQLQLSPEEVSDLLKEQLAAHAQISPDVVLTGARITLQQDGLSADVTLRVRDRLDVGGRLDFALRWEGPELVAAHTATHIRGTMLPRSWLQLPPLRVNLAAQLPPHIGVRTLRFTPDGWIADLKLQ